MSAAHFLYQDTTYSMQNIIFWKMKADPLVLLFYVLMNVLYLFCECVFFVCF